MRAHVVEVVEYVRLDVVLKARVGGGGREQQVHAVPHEGEGRGEDVERRHCARGWDDALGGGEGALDAEAAGISTGAGAGAGAGVGRSGQREGGPCGRPSRWLGRSGVCAVVLKHAK